jgi:hypothetical protein
MSSNSNEIKARSAKEFCGADWWRYKYNMRLDTAKEILDFVKDNNLKDTKSILK